MILEHQGYRMEFDWDHERTHYRGVVEGTGLELYASRYCRLAEMFYQAVEAHQREAA